MAVSTVSVSSTDTVNTVTVTDTSNISVVTVGEQGLGGPSTVLGRGVASVTAGSSDDNSLLMYDHGATSWSTTARIDDAINVGGLTVRSGGVATLPEIRTATIKYSDGDAAITIADGGTVNIASVNLTTVTLSGKLTANNNEIEGNNFDINGGDIASGVTINKSPTITLGGDLSGSATLTALGNATLTATITADATALGTDTTGAYVETIVAGEGIDVSGSGSETANVTISAEDASDSNKGIASFDATDFSVSSGAVTLQAERIQDIVGAMTTSNTESGISVAYQDSDGTLDFDVADFDIALTGDVTGSGTVTNLGNVSFATTIAANSVALGTDTTGNYVADLTAGEGIDVSGGGSENATITVSAEDATASNKGIASFDSTDFTVSSGAVTLNSERISDIVGAMVSSNTESGISVAYQDSDNTLDFDVGDFDVALTGDVTGSGTVTNLGNVSITTTVAANSVALGTDTTGDYVGTITGGTGIDSTAATSGEGTTHTLSLDLNELTTETSIADADFIAMVDASDDGSGKITFENLEDAIFSSVSGDVAIAEDGTATIQANSVALGTDTTGNYMAEVSAGEGIDISHTQGEGSTATISAELATETNAGVATFDGTDFTVTSGDVTINAERVQDIVGAMVGSNTESGIAVTYEDSDGTLDFDVNDPTITIDGDMSGSATMTNLGNTTITSTLDTVNSNVGSFGSATVIPAITVNAKGLVTAVSTNSISTSFTLSADSGSNDTFNTGETLTISGTSNEIETAVSDNEITIGLPDNVTIGGNLTVTGNYTVNGTTTTVNTSNMVVSDNLIELNNGASTNANDSGIVIERGSTGDNAIFVWDESADKFTMGTTTATGASTGNLTITTGTLVANLEGNVTGDLTGNADTATTLETARTIHGVSFDGSANIDLTEVVQDTVGAMFSSNTETGITVTYEDGDGTIDLVIGTLNQDTTGTAALATEFTVTANNSTDETVYPIFVDGATGSQGAETDTGLSYNPSSGNLTIGGELSAATLDISGNVDIDGTLETDALTINGTTLSETIADTVGAMVSSNTETGITVSYEDSDNTLDFVIGTLNQDTTGNAATATALETGRTIALSGDVTASGVSFDGTGNISLTTTIAANSVALGTDTTGNYVATVADAGNSRITVANSGSETAGVTLDIADNAVGTDQLAGIARGKIIYGDASGNPALLALGTNGQVLKSDGTDLVWGSDSGLSTEEVQDIVGAMFSSNTETGITVTYEDGDGTIDLVVGTLNQDTTGNAATATALETGRTIGMTGDVVWTSASFDGSGNVTGTATIQANSVALGTDTTGNYVDNVTGGTGVTVSGSAGEGWEPAIAIGQAVGTSDSVTFGSVAVDNFTLNGTELDLSSGDFTLDVAGDINLDADGGDIVLKDGGTQFGKISNASTITQFNTVDSIIVPKGTTGQRPTGVAGMFRYNTTDGKFEGYTNAWGEIGGGGSGLFSTNKFTGDASTTAFTMSTAPADENYVVAFIDGVYQNKDAFNVSGTTITFDTAPANSKTVIVHVVGSTVSGANANLDTFTGNGSATDFTMALDPITENNTQVYIDGVYQMKSAYSISGTTLTFSAAPANNASIDVMTFTQNTLNAPANDSVTSAKLSGALVTPSSLDVNGNELILDADADTSITADTDDRIDIKIAGTDQLQLTDGAILPVTTNDIDLGSSSKQFKDAYIDGTLEADAITIAGTSLAETISDTVGAMVGSNTETGIAVTYDDSDNTLDFVLSASQSTITSLGTLTALTGGTGDFNWDSGTLFVDSSANKVGIGTTSPAHPLHFGANNSYYISIGSANTTAGGNDPILGVFNNADIASATFGWGLYDSSADGSLQLWNKNSSTTGYDVMTFKRGGNVGIGTASPSAPLQVAASPSDTVGTVGISLKDVDNAIEFGLRLDATSKDLHIDRYYSGSWHNHMSFDRSSGNIGIGTSSPAQKLHLSVGGGSSVRMRLSAGSYGNANIGMDETGLNIATDGAQANAYGNINLVPSGEGRVGIGTTSPSDVLDVTRTSTDQTVGLTLTNLQSGGYGSGIIFRSKRSDSGDIKDAAKIRVSGESSWNSDGSTDSALIFDVIKDNSLSEKMRIVSDGALIINGTSKEVQGSCTWTIGSRNPVQCFNASAFVANMEFMTFRNQNTQIGSVTAPSGGSSTSFNTSSDYRLKENVTYTWDATTKLKQLKPARFNWIADDTNTLEEGFLAHEVQTVVPNAVTGTKDQMEDYVDDEGETQQRVLPQQIDHSKLVPLLVKTIQELEARIETLEDA